MKKLLGLMIVPVLMASLPAAAANRTTDMTTPELLNKMMPTTDIQRPAYQQAIGTQAHTLFTQGQWQLVEQNYPRAIELFEASLQSNPDFIPSLQGLAVGYLTRGEYTPAFKAIEKALMLDPINTKLYLTKARILDAQHKEPEALEAYLTYLSLDPTDSGVVEIQRRSNDLYEKWEAKLTPTQKQYFEGLRLLSMEQPQKALPLFKQFIASEPTLNEQTINAHRLLSVSYGLTKQPTEAVKIMEALVKQQPENPLGYFHLSESYTMTGQREQAKEAWGKFVQFAPKSSASQIIENVKELPRHTN